jgi:hypothetical protein
MAEELKTYPVPWAGKLILACRKCQKKMKGNAGHAELARLKKTVKRIDKAIKKADRRDDTDRGASLLHVINVPCMDLCPKDGVTVYRPGCGRLSILRSAKDLESLCTDVH